MKSLLVRTAKFCHLLLRLGSPRVAWKLKDCRGARHNFCRANGQILLRDVAIPVDERNAVMLANAGSMMRRLSSHAGAKWQLLPDNKLEARLNELEFEVAGTEDIFILTEVFERGVYSISRPPGATVIDIGANIGVSALYFASQPWVRHVHAFEPLGPTARLARANIERNPRLRDKISLYEYGLGRHAATLQVEYSPEWKGNAGRQKLPANLLKTVPSWTETITIRPASKSVLEILPAEAQTAVVMKMDCEGAEWEILPDLAQSGVLKRIDQLIFEWHDRTPEALEQLLVDNGFAVVRRADAENGTVGLIYAAKLTQNHC